MLISLLAVHFCHQIYCYHIIDINAVSWMVLQPCVNTVIKPSFSFSTLNLLIR